MILLSLTGALTVLLVSLGLGSRLTLLRWSVQPVALRWLFVANLAGLGYRAYAAIDAYRSAPATQSSLPTRLGIAAIAVLLIVPHGAAAYYDIVQYDLITSVFAAPTAPEPVTTSAAPTTEPPFMTVVPLPGVTPPVTTPTLPRTTTTTTTTTAPPRLWDGKERLNILLLGGDAGVGRTGVRTDTIIVVSIEPATGDIAMFSVPRNMARVPLPADLDIWSCDCFPKIINELWDYGERNPDRFPGSGPPGAEAMKLAIGELLGIPIHYFALVNLDGFVAMIDAIGGVDIVVPTRVYDASYPHENGTTVTIDIKPGEYHMDGHLALAYARSRHGSDDYNRMGRQRCVLQAVADQASPGTLLRSFPAIAAAIKDSVTTDIPLDRLPDFVDLVARLDADRIVSLPLVPPRYTGKRTPDGYNTPNLEVIRKSVNIALTTPPDQAIELLGLNPIDQTCASVDVAEFGGE